MKKLAIVIAAALTELNAEGKQWARIVFVDPSSGRKASRLFDKDMLVAYTVGKEVEGVEVKSLESAPFSLTEGGKMFNHRNTVVMRGEEDIQAFINNHGKSELPDAKPEPTIEAKTEEKQAEELQA